MLAAALLAFLAGCTTETTCADWVTYESAQDAYDDAALVVIGTTSDPTGTVKVLGVDVPVHPVRVEKVLKGDAPESLTVAQTPMTCGADPVPDPLAADGRVILMLANAEGVWRPLTPFTGVLEAPVGDPLPFETD